VREASHPEAGSVEDIQICDPALDILQALDRQHSANRRIPVLSIGKQAIDV